jgi:hypothetical protein
MGTVALLYFFGSVDEIWVVEILWSVAAAIGLAFSLYNFYQTFLDFRALKERGIENGRRLLAKSSVVLEGLRSLIQFGFLFVGVWAMVFIPKLQVPLPTNYAIYAYASRYIFLASAILLTVKTLVAWYTRKQILEAPAGFRLGSPRQRTDDLDQTHPITSDPGH